jgi:hypothetical protein
MTPADSLTALKSLVAQSIETTVSNIEADKKAVLDSIKTITFEYKAILFLVDYLFSMRF